MTLLELLRQELPKRGGWPDDSDEMCQSQFDCEIYTNSKLLPDFYVGERAEDNGIYNAVTREQYESALAAKNEGWIEWGGGECPVEEGVLVDVKYRDGYDFPDALGVPALSGYGTGSAFWELDGYNNDIIAYRLHKPQEAEQVRPAAWNAYAGITEADEEADLNDCIEQDASPVWNGEGAIPPVGCECEYLDSNNEWYPVTIKYASNQIVVICGMTNIFGEEQETEIAKDIQLDKPQFRPLRTEAERAIDEMVRLSGVSIGAAKILYDAGYRK